MVKLIEEYMKKIELLFPDLELWQRTALEQLILIVYTDGRKEGMNSMPDFYNPESSSEIFDSDIITNY